MYVLIICIYANVTLRNKDYYYEIVLYTIISVFLKTHNQHFRWQNYTSHITTHKIRILNVITVYNKYVFKTLMWIWSIRFRFTSESRGHVSLHMNIVPRDCICYSLQTMSFYLLVLHNVQTTRNKQWNDRYK